MARKLGRESRAGEHLVCAVNHVDDEVVARLKPEVDRIEGVAAHFKALADETRVKIVYALSQAELCVCDVAALIGGSKATASYHLRLLNHLGLADYRKDGKLVYYRLTDQLVGQLVRDVLVYKSAGTHVGGESHEST